MSTPKDSLLLHTKPELKHKKKKKGATTESQGLPSLFLLFVVFGPTLLAKSWFCF
ncbi:hypothetical protein RhiirB3_454729 [Rhizophagus irregularis]|nr:hypothetical protein RhiirB3_454729 [Rhizophagus irregularis]